MSTSRIAFLSSPYCWDPKFVCECQSVYVSSVPHREAETWVWVWLCHWSSDKRHSLLPLLFSLTGLQEPDVIWKYFDLKPLFEPVKERFVLLLVCRELHGAVDTTPDLGKMSLGNGAHTCTHRTCYILVRTMTVNLHKVWMVTMGLQTDNGSPGFPMLMLHQNSESIGTGLAPKQFPNYCGRRQWRF